MKHPRHPSRRLVLQRALAGTAMLCAAPRALAFARKLTPRQTAGPFYPEQLPLDSDNDLLRVGNGPLAEGTAAEVYGQVVNRSGEGLPEIEVEIWQCDARGRYHHQDDDQSRRLDPNFQGFGRTITDAQGRYRFRTIRPVAYPGRAPHIHFRLSGAEIEELTTQLYVAGDPANGEDWLFRQLGPRADRVVAEFVPSDTDEATLLARWDLVVVSRES